MKKLICFMALCFGTTLVYGQDMLGIRHSNYSGLQGLGINPSSIIDSRWKVDINIIGAGTTFENDYLFIPKENLKFIGIGNILDRIDAKQYLDDFLKGNADLKNLGFATTVMGPGVMFTLNKKHTFAATWNVRAAITTRDLIPEAARYSFTELEDQDLFTRNPKQFRARDFTFNAMAWQEYTLTYGTVFHNKNRHFFKGAATLKYLSGISGGYVRDADIYFNVSDDSTMIFGPSSFEYGRVSYNAFDDKAEDKQTINNGNGFGWDLGVTYEWRRESTTYTYEMDGEMMENPELNKYIFRVGASLLDMGRINYRNNAKVFNISSPNALHVYPQYDIDEFDSQLDFDSSVSAIFYGASYADTTGQYNTLFYNDSVRALSFKNAKDKFIMELPSAWSIQFAWNVYKRFYLNGTIIQGFNHKKKPGVDRPDMLALTPRYESEWLDISLPFSVINYNESQTRLGIAFRIGSIFFGSDKFGTLFGLSDLYGMDAYAGIKFSLLQAKPRDRDNDKVSDKKDRCIDVPGVWKFAGCPDRDGDDIQDSEDACPDVKGLAKFNGCPDRDGDDIQDAKDECPDDPGLLEFMGCPDRDGDKIIDKTDSCPDLPGVPEFFGCPDRDGDKIIDTKDDCPDQKGLPQYNGCPDSDGDEIPDPKDKCPYEIGPLSNEGCPVKVEKAIIKTAEPIKIELTKEEEEVINTVFKNLQFETGKAIIKPVSYESLSKLADLLKRKTDYKLLIEGHTDNVGAAKMNLGLSDRRAKAAKDYLIKEGVGAERITSKGYGMTKPVAPNTTPEGRQQNRRVEFTIVK